MNITGPGSDCIRPKDVERIPPHARNINFGSYARSSNLGEDIIEENEAIAIYQIQENVLFEWDKSKNRGGYKTTTKKAPDILFSIEITQTESGSYHIYFPGYKATVDFQSLIPTLQEIYRNNISTHNTRNTVEETQQIISDKLA